ncbi:keratin-associated protein 20-2-like [Pteronotus mesoamericanus]|uniref:keratin-associated protein 20-2-like n=1 Tax=Pteronotus mesoamericanus TaxID=1884717 RepID=UPI0023EAEED4|nr:keratin-associated protein 20-2-like [Pteronotus parnellii mesoamericanus]
MSCYGNYYSNYYGGLGSGSGCNGLSWAYGGCGLGGLGCGYGCGLGGLGCGYSCGLGGLGCGYGCGYGGLGCGVYGYGGNRPSFCRRFCSYGFY